MKFKKITSNIIHVNFESQIEMCETFCRFQEHYESPAFKGKVFTLGQYREWYSEQFGKWSYYTDWHGFNIPDYALKAFKDGLFDPLTEEEQEFLDMFRYKKGKFYVIGTYGEAEALEHEICHALFYLDADYRIRVSDIISKIDKKESAWIALEDFLLNAGYAAEFIDDEIQAFLACNEEFFEKYKLEIPKDAYLFMDLKEEYFEKYGI